MAKKPPPPKLQTTVAGQVAVERARALLAVERATEAAKLAANPAEASRMFIAVCRRNMAI